MVQREQNWEMLLHNFVESRKKQPFKYGINDCALFVADAIQAMTGTDVAADFRGKYTDMLSSLAIIKQVTGGTTVEDVAVFEFAKSGIKELSTVKLAQRGDVVLCNNEGAPALGIVYLNGIDGLFVGTDGLFKVAVLACRRAWRV
jgi:hypothetical protein